MGLLDPVGLGLNAILGENTVAAIPIVGGLLGAKSDAEKALLKKQKQMAAEAAARRQQQMLEAPNMNATAQSLLAFNPLNQRMAQTYGTDAAFTPQQFADMVQNPNRMPDIDTWARQQQSQAGGGGSPGGMREAFNQLSGQQGKPTGGGLPGGVDSLVNYQGTDPKVQGMVEEYIRQKQQFEQAEERRRQLMLQGMSQPGPGPAPLGPRAAPAPTRRF